MTILSSFFSHIDLKKTMAVLLQNIMERLTKLEQRVDQALLNNSLSPNLRKELEAVRSEVKELPALAGPVPNNPDHPMFPVLPDKEDQKVDKNGAAASVTRLKMDGPVDAKGKRSNDTVRHVNVGVHPRRMNGAAPVGKS